MLRAVDFRGPRGAAVAVNCGGYGRHLPMRLFAKTSVVSDWLRVGAVTAIF